MDAARERRGSRRRGAREEARGNVGREGQDVGGVPSPNGGELDPTRQAAVQVVERLKETILALEMEPGTVINRQALQDAFGLSSTPVRDALMKLGEEGLVDIFPQSATRVSLIDVAKARQAQFLRRAIEQEVVRTLAAAEDKGVLGDLERLIELQRVAAEQDDVERFDALDREFHNSLIEAAGVPDLFWLIRQRSGHIDRIRRLNLPVPGKMQQVLRDHDLIVKAIAAGDAEKAPARMREHLSRSLAYSPSLRKKHPTFFKD